MQWCISRKISCSGVMGVIASSTIVIPSISPAVSQTMTDAQQLARNHAHDPPSTNTVVVDEIVRRFVVPAMHIPTQAVTKGFLCVCWFIARAFTMLLLVVYSPLEVFLLLFVLFLLLMEFDYFCLYLLGRDAVSGPPRCRKDIRCKSSQALLHQVLSGS